MSDFKITCSIAKAYEKNVDGILKRFIGGLASGTQVDLEGERMADSAIQAFKKAIDEGMTLPDGQWSLIPLRSGHRHEWDDVLGWITGAEVDKENNLWIEAELDHENPVSVSLFKKLTRTPEHGKPVKLGFSVGGTVNRAGYEWDEDINDFTKTYYDVSLREVSVVSQPAYPTSYLYALNKSVNWDALRPKKDDAKVKAQLRKSDEGVIGPSPANRFQPSEAMQASVERALKWCERGRTCDDASMETAMRIQSNQPFSEDEIDSLHSFFSTHEIDKHIVGFFAEQAGFPCIERVAWDLHGGDAGYRWAHERLGMRPDGEPTDEDHTVLSEGGVPTDSQETTKMENTNEQDTTLTMTQNPLAEEAVTEMVEKTEVQEADLVVEQEVEKSIEEESVQTEPTDAVDPLTLLAGRVDALSATVESLVTKLASTEKSVEPAQDESVEKAVTTSSSQEEVIKNALMAALEPIVQRLDRIENEPVDKSYAVLRSKYDNETYEDRVEREIGEVEGRDAVRRALELAFKNQ